MSSITTIKTLRTVDIKLIPNRFFALCISIIMLACANTCIAQEKEQFKLVKNVTELQEGDIVIVVNNTNEHCSALSTKWDYRKIDGYKIDIKSASAAHEWEEEDALAEAERAAQAAEEAAEDAVFAEEPADGEDTLPDDEAPAAEEPAEDSTEEAPAEEASNDETPAEEAPEAPEA